MKNKIMPYVVKYIGQENVEITGKGDSSFWDIAGCLADFKSPWDLQEIKKIEFRSVWNEEKIFFNFKVYDAEVHIDAAENIYDSVNNSDRVELFFRTDENLSPYYCLEIDPLSRIMDFMAYPNKKFDFGWNWPVDDIEVKSSVESQYFNVEIAISLSSLHKFGLLKDGKIETGIYRAKYNKQDDGHFEPCWISWVDPGTNEPNFHIASSFGLLELEKNT